MRILLADDEQTIREVVSDYLDQLGHQVTQCGNGHQALDLFKRDPFPMVLTDIRMPGLNGIELLQGVKETPQGQNSDIVLITGYGELDSAIQAFRAGAYDYLLKPVELIELRAVVDRIAEHQSLLKENYELTHHFEKKLAEATRQTELKLKYFQKAYAEVVGMGRIGIFSRKMREVVAMAMRLHEDRSVPVLIEGETGTGKEVVARLVHYGSSNVTVPFISINCSAISANLFESELFGYEGGAFTGAKKDGSMGKLELARGGTLFFDEIGDMPLELQPKLLRILQEREFYRVGGLKKVKLDARIICASNRNLAQLIKEGSFRRDLFYRLNIGRIYIPSLRKRREDIEPLAKMFLNQFAERKKSRFKLIQKEAMKILKGHSWPGNVRELENTIERVILLYDDMEIRPEHFNFLSSESGDVFTHNGTQFSPDSIILPPEGLNLKDLETRIIQKALSAFYGNKSKTAEYLGISRSALQRKVKKFIDPAVL